ncbi:NlpC/P60 family protein [Salicola sp. Rm-C-2C1-2]|uniref:NlpC/P60 family protein n=1 Tax=Salicola sp. Rm-C-2C1-2 TaxID=3141321 RepID=UPI0032E51568
MIRQLCCCLALITLVGCASTGGSLQESVSVTPRENAVDLADRQRVRSILLDQYAQWKGTPHRMGGMSQSGVDCSGLVHRTFLARLGHDIPRTTKYQATVGERIRRDRLRPGDLVFFRTGYKTRHVGIYTGNARFLHASSSEGVTTSALSDPYWTSNYWQARRVR